MADAGSELRKFTTDLSLYEKGRPEYTQESVRFLLNRVGVLPWDRKEPIKLLEIASGTGKFTRAMVKVLEAERANVEVIASDSQEVMCDAFRKLVPGIEVHHFPAEKIGEAQSTPSWCLTPSWPSNSNYVENNPFQRVIHFPVYYIGEVLSCFLFRIWPISLFLRAVVNISTQALIISQELELGPPVHAHTLISDMWNTKFCLGRAASQINHVIPIPWEDFEFSLFVTLEMTPKTPFVIFFFFTVCLTREKVFKFVTNPQKGLASVNFVFVPAWSLVVNHIVFHLQFGTYTYQLVLSYKIIDWLLTVTCYCPPIATPLPG